MFLVFAERRLRANQPMDLGALLADVNTPPVETIGVLAVELGIFLAGGTQGSTLTLMMAAAFFAAGVFFVYRSFYGMRIGEK